MQKEDNACIRYLMKEMDPSEEMLMERAMMEDDDLLIEVESLRQTLKRLDGLPERKPPSHLTESILRRASEYSNQRQPSSTSLSITPFKYAAAALLLGVSLGGFWLYQEMGAATDEKQTAQASSSASQAAAETAEPWVDRNNVIRFTDQFEAGNTEFQTIMQQSQEKLTPVTDPFQFSNGSRSLQMTGASPTQ